MSRRYQQVRDGDRVTPQMKNYRMACCDCGLVHVIDFEVVTVLREKGGGVFTGGKPRNAKNLRVVLIPRRDNRKTAALRREKAKRDET
jgi:hypothetical protein